MKYKTVIEVVCEAENKDEAMDVAGEFLSGQIENGVKMRCFSRPLSLSVISKLSKGFIGFALIASLGVLSVNLLHKEKENISSHEASAIQPPLRTERNENFKEEWQNQEFKKALETVKDR